MNKKEDKIRQFYYKKSRIHQYKGFCYVVQLGTADKAAKKMGLTPAAVTLQIKSLEEDLNIKLFNRTPDHRLAITTKGRLLYEKLYPLTQEMDSIAEEFLLETNNIINISAPITTSLDSLPYIIKNHLSTFPSTKINIFNLTRSESIEKIRKSELDLGLHCFYKNEKMPIELNIVPIFEFKMVVIANKNHPISNIKEDEISIKELRKYNFLHQDNNLSSDAYEDFVNNNEKINVTLSEGSWGILKNMVKINSCLGLVGDYYLKKEDKEHIVYKYVPGLFPSFYFSFFTKKGSYINPVLSNLIEEIKKFPWKQK